MSVKVPSLLHKMSPTYQKAWYNKNKMPLPAHLTGSVAQAKKEVKPTERVKKLQARSLQAYGATKGVKVGGEHGSDEVRDTIAPLTRDQHSKVQAAERAAKAATAKPKRTKPLSQAERMAAIAAAVRKGKAKHDVATVDPDDMDHDDLRDVHQSLHVRKTYSEEVEQVNELKSSTLQSYLDKRPSPKIKDVARPETVGKPEERAKDIARANLTRIGRARAKAKLLKRNPPPRTAPQYDPNDRGYGQGRYMGDSVNLEGQVMNEVSKKEAEAALGGPTKLKPKGPAGKLPLGFRMARSAARKAMKGQIDAVHKSMEKTMKKEEVEQVVEQDDSMQKKEMAQTQLHFMAYAAKEILEFIDMGGEIEEWYQNKLSKVQSEVESLHSYIEGEKRRTGMVKEEEQIDEKAPPGAKFERMVKHIKKGYAKGGLTPKEKSIAYATAWKAYGKKNEEVEQVTEAEGTVAVTPKEKALAAHHGDPKKITYGDVIKARLKSVAAKKMGK